VPARRPAGGHDSIGIDAQLGGVFAHPANGALGILDALFGRDAVPRLHPIIGPGGDHAPTGEVAGLRLELSDLAGPDFEHITA